MKGMLSKGNDIKLNKYCQIFDKAKNVLMLTKRVASYLFIAFWGDMIMIGEEVYKIQGDQIEWRTESPYH